MIYKNMFSYKIITKPSFKISRKIIDEIFFQIDKNIKKIQNWTLNIIFVNWEEIRKLNKTYRKKDYITDVLSFNYETKFTKLKKKDIVWEIVFCEEKIIEQWIEYSLWSEKEFYKLLIHSVLHILWYDHENDKDFEKMQKKEDLLWKKIFEKNKNIWKK